MIHKSTLALAFTAATVLGVVAAPAQAASFNLANLISTGGSITVGDKLFSNFTCSIQITGVATPSNCNNINVRTVDDDPFGLLFQTGFSAGSPSRVTPSSLTALFGYDVTVLDPNQRLSAARLRFNGAGSPGSLLNGNVSTKVTQSITNIPDGTSLLNPSDSLMVTNPPNYLNDREDLTELVSKARVENKLEITAKNRGVGFVSLVENRYEQTEVPEPGTVGGLVALGSFGVGVMLKNKGKSNDKN
ncbi:MAG TPA: hypothetical protein DD379_26285 [Cyanobacteria bacterium UBA11162]|nr:hypothetical protein [Cyanobacteria bacterium UBA11162]